jgi:hypothetical protein
MKPKQQIAVLEEKLRRSEAREKSLQDKWIKAERAKGPAMADGIERKKLEKQLRVIGYIAAGKSSEAILEILEPMPVLFTMQVAFADEKTKLASEDEHLEKLKNVVIEAVKGAKLKREKGWVAEHKDGQIVAEYKEKP